MCTFMSTAEMPTQSSKNGNKSNSFIDLYLKPNKEGEQYRFRLLFYRQPAKNDRKTPYFSQMIHDHWGVTDKGNKVVDDFVICPGTKYSNYDEDKFVLNEKTGKKQLNCPICQKAQQNFVVWKNSGYKDKVSMQKYNSLKAKFRGYVPVYVVNDPNNEKNNGKLKCIVFTNKDEFDAFDKLVQEEKSKAYLSSKEGKPYEIFNGGNGVDFYMRMEIVPEVRNAGKSNEYTASVRKITQMAFGKKAYPIPSINKEAIDGFDFDDKHYTSNLKDELSMFYKKYFGQDDVVVPDEELDVFSSNSVPTEQVKVENASVVNSEKKTETSFEGVNSVLDDLTEDIDNSVDETPSVDEDVPSTNDSSDIKLEDINDLMSELNI